MIRNKSEWMHNFWQIICRWKMDCITIDFQWTFEWIGNNFVLFSQLQLLSPLTLIHFSVVFRIFLILPHIAIYSLKSRASFYVLNALNGKYQWSSWVAIERETIQKWKWTDLSLETNHCLIHHYSHTFQTDVQFSYE